MSDQRLRQADVDTLRRARQLRDRFDAGIFPRGAGQHRHFARLERLGLIEFDGWGRDMDGEVSPDVPIYKLTNRGALCIAIGRVP